MKFHTKKVFYYVLLTVWVIALGLFAGYLCLQSGFFADDEITNYVEERFPAAFGDRNPAETEERLATIETLADQVYHFKLLHPDYSVARAYEIVTELGEDDLAYEKLLGIGDPYNELHYWGYLLLMTAGLMGLICCAVRLSGKRSLFICNIFSVLLCVLGMLCHIFRLFYCNPLEISCYIAVLTGISLIEVAIEYHKIERLSFDEKAVCTALLGAVVVFVALFGI